MLVKLQMRFAPTTEARELELELVRRFTQLYTKPLQSIGADKWLQEWERIYGLCRRLNLPDISGNCAQQDFLVLVKTINSEFADY